MNRENEKVRFLGLDTGKNIDELNGENFHNTVQKMMQSLHFWKGKYLQWNLAIADMLYSEHLSIADPIFWNEFEFSSGHPFIVCLR